MPGLSRVTKRSSSSAASPGSVSGTLGSSWAGPGSGRWERLGYCGSVGRESGVEGGVGSGDGGEGAIALRAVRGVTLSWAWSRARGRYRGASLTTVGASLTSEKFDSDSQEE